jgi:ABC-2 type transport system permease protein
MKPALNRCAAIAGKEWTHIVRDTRSLILALAAPVFLIILFGYALTMDVSHIGFTVVDNDRSTATRALTEKFMHTEYFTFMGASDAYSGTDALFNKRKITLALVFSPGFKKDIERGRSGRVQMLIDGSDATTANITLGYASTIINAYSQELARKRNLKRGNITPEMNIIVEPRFWYNETMVTKNYILPGLTALVLAIICALIASLAVSREYERGTLESILSTPVRPAEFIIGKILPYILIGMFDTVTTITISHFAFDLPFKGYFFELLLITILFVGGMSGLGILISAATRSQVLSVQASMIVTYLPTFILSGFIFPIANMPVVVKAITYLIPAKYLITVTKGIALKGVGSSFLFVQIMFLLLFFIIVTALAIRTFSAMLPYRRHYS